VFRAEELWFGSRKGGVEIGVGVGGMAGGRGEGGDG